MAGIWTTKPTDALSEYTDLDMAEMLATRYLGTPVEIWTCAVPDEGMVVSDW